MVISPADVVLARFLTIHNPQHIRTPNMSQPLDNPPRILYNNTVRFDKHMRYIIFNEEKQKVGEFASIYELESFVDSVREGRGECYPITDRMSPFDYLKQIRWFMTIDDQKLSA